MVREYELESGNYLGAFVSDLVKDPNRKTRYKVYCIDSNENFIVKNV